MEVFFVLEGRDRMTAMDEMSFVAVGNSCTCHRCRSVSFLLEVLSNDVPNIAQNELPK